MNIAIGRTQADDLSCLKSAGVNDIDMIDVLRISQEIQGPFAELDTPASVSVLARFGGSEPGQPL